MNMGGRLERNAREDLAKFEAQKIVQDVVHHPQRHFGNPCRKFANFNPIELVDVDPGQAFHIENALTFRMQLSQQIDFKDAQFPISDDQKIAAAARRVKEIEAGKLVMKCFQCVGATSIAPRFELLE